MRALDRGEGFHTEVSRSDFMPDGWSAAPLKRFFRVVGGATPTSDPENWGGDIPWVTPGDLSGLDTFYISRGKRSISERGHRSSSTELVPKGSVIVSTRAPIGSLAIAQEALCTNQGCKALVPTTTVDSRFFAYALSVATPQLNALGQGSTFLELSGESLGSFRLPVPSYQEQCRIAAFLDHETARIDELVREQERMLELLVEERASIVSRAIFDENETTAKARLGYFVDLLSGFAFPSDRFSHDSTEIRLLRGANVGVGAVRWDDVVFWHRDQLLGLERFLLEEGDIVLGMDRPWISTGARVAEVRSTDLPALLVQRVARMRARNGLCQHFLRFVLESREFQASVEADLTGVSVPHISAEQILSFRIPVFSLSEQERRVANAETRLGALERTSREVTAMMALLQERRAALVSASVTGQLDLRNWRQSEPEAVAEVA